MLRSGAERARDYMCDVVSLAAPPMVESGAAGAGVGAGVLVSVDVFVSVFSFLAQPETVNVRATSITDESAKSFRILCSHLLWDRGCAGARPRRMRMRYSRH
jgi:hypothetical protein